MATFTLTTRTPPAGRAAMILLVCVEALSLTLCGCYSPWRILRRNEPSLEELLVAPERWDAESRLAEDATGRRTDVMPGMNRMGSRANPYANRNMPAKTSDEQRADAEPFTEADFAEAYAAAPPHLRPLLKRQWEATQAATAGDKGRPLAARANGSRTPARPAGNNALGNDALGDDEIDDDALGDDAMDDRIADDATAGDGDGDGGARRDRLVGRSPSDRPLGQDSSAVRTAEGRRRTAPEQAGMPPRTKVLPASHEEPSPDEPVRFSLSDEDEAVATPRPRAEDLKPPAEKRTSRQVAHAEPIDTGLSEQVKLQPAPRQAGAPQSGTAKTSPSSGPVALASTQPSPAVTAAPASHTQPANTADAGPADASVAAPPLKEMTWHDHVREALRQLEKENSDSVASPTEQLNSQAVSRMLHLALGELEPALKPIEGLQPAEQDFFRHQFQALHDAIDPRGNPVLARRWTLVMDSQRQATSHLGAVSNLEIKNAAFCSNVDGFGSVTKFPSANFRAKQEVLLYCELENFVSLPVKDGFQTVLQGSYEIVDASGHRVFEALLSEDSDICRHQRRDYFIAYRIYMPDNLQAGRYQLRLTIEDMKGRKFGQSALDFQIAQ